MPKWEVEVSFVVEAEDKDDAVAVVRDALSDERQPIELMPGIEGFFTYDGCVSEHDDG